MSKDEISNLPPDMLRNAEMGGDRGLWLEMTCPDASCVDDQGNITIPAQGIETSEKEGFFLNLFCPNNRCEIIQSTDLP
jgi:hypothetical protein